MAEGIRDRNRAENTAKIMNAARNQLAEAGASGLSLRSIAREIDMVSSAVYRYVASRDDLLTRLIIEAYDAVGQIAEAAAGPSDGASDSDLDRWLCTASAVRTWALDHPHEYLLLYGTPVPGYAAPGETSGPGTRVARTLVTIVDEANRSNRLAPAAPAELAPALAGELERLADIVESTVPPSVMLATLVGWTQMYGLLSFELTNQTRGVVESHRDLFLAAVAQTGRSIGLR